MRLLLAVVAAGALLASDSADPIPVPTNLSSEFHWADGQVFRAQQALNLAMQARDQALAEMKAFCQSSTLRDDALQVDAQGRGRFICAPPKKGP